MQHVRHDTGQSPGLAWALSRSMSRTLLPAEDLEVWLRNRSVGSSQTEQL